jgi:hypothetical protein
MSEKIHKARNASIIMYQIICPAKYRRVVLNEAIDKTLKEICKGISERYEIKFL